MKIRIRTKLNGRTVLNSFAKQGVSVDSVCDLARKEVDSGYADKSIVYVDGVIYEEYEV